MSREDRSAIVAQFFRAMQAGATGKATLVALFHPDAVYIEPFGGTPRVHRGREAILRAFAEGWKNPLPDMRIEVDRVDVDMHAVTAHWTCHSPAIPGGSGRGVNVFTVSGGLITRLETRLLGDQR